MLIEDTLPEMVKKHGKTMPNKCAICSGDKKISYGELYELILVAENALKLKGINKGDFIVISAAMKWEYIVMFLAIKSIRAIVVPILNSASVEEANYIISKTEASLFITDSPKYSKISIVSSFKYFFETSLNFPRVKSDDVVNVISDDELSEILFTSGTTGTPKGVMLSQGGLKASIYNTYSGMGMEMNDVILLPLPLNHSFGLRVLRAALFNGETIVLQNGFSFAGELKEKIEKHKCNCMIAVTAGFQMLLDQMGDLYKSVFGKMKYIEFSAGAVPTALRNKLIKDLPDVKLYNTWGSTETGGSLFLNFSEQQDKIESAGKAINDIELGIVSDDGDLNAVVRNEYGRLAIKSNAIMLGYYKDPELTNKTIKGEWLFTNDLARLDSDGYVYLNGRVDDLISIGGEKVSPTSIEKIASSFEGVQECCCIGVNDPDGLLGQIPILFVIPNKKFNEKNFLEHFRICGNGYMVPKRIIQIQEMPHNYMGKTDRNMLNKIWEDSQSGNSSHSLELSDQIMNLMLTRRSIRNFTEDPVSDKDLKKLVDVARMAPSGHNMQTWRFTVLKDKSLINRIKMTTKSVAEKKKTPFYGFLNPAALIIVSNDRRNPDSIQDSSAAIENILLMAHALKLGACWLNSWISISDEPETRTILDEFGIPKSHIVYGLVALGHPASQSKMPAKKNNVAVFFN